MMAPPVPPGWLQELHAKYGSPYLDYPDAAVLGDYRRQCWIWFIGGQNWNLAIDDFGSRWRVAAGAGPRRAELHVPGRERPPDADIRQVLVLAGMLDAGPPPVKDGKLVRDRIPDIIRASGEIPLTRVASPQEMPGLLAARLIEEAAEAAAAEGREDQRAELADVLEAAYALGCALGIGQGELEGARMARLIERGGFTGRTVWLGNEPSPA